ncbi:hypothetical protein BKA66DRAFT_270800 [Pyrenochaeta sp. MPI-SDFR-AT-0127]|nr:hypothetical protein BKA66DRAFT_270800 [Pyrenochaeta sp. MPI-SDFR-AT-0127]
MVGYCFALITVYGCTVLNVLQSDMTVSTFAVHGFWFRSVSNASPPTRPMAGQSEGRAGTRGACFEFTSRDTNKQTNLQHFLHQVG